MFFFINKKRIIERGLQIIFERLPKHSQWCLLELKDEKKKQNKTKKQQQKTKKTKLKKGNKTDSEKLK